MYRIGEKALTDSLRVRLRLKIPRQFESAIYVYIWLIACNKIML